MKQCLIEWVMECNISKSHVTNLLKRLQEHANMAYLPRGSRTLLYSCRGKYAYKTCHLGNITLSQPMEMWLVAVKSSGQTIPEKMKL